MIIKVTGREYRQLQDCRNCLIAVKVVIANDCSWSCQIYVYVVVQFYPWFNFYFLLFHFIIIIYQHKKEPRKVKIELQDVHAATFVLHLVVFYLLSL